MSKKITKKCQNPNCQKDFVCGHYGALQQVGTGPAHIHIISCPPCKGTGVKRGEKCKRCGGTKKIKQSCTDWRRGWWAQTRKPPRGMTEEEQTKALKAAEKEDVRFWALLVTARNSALRKGELLGLTWSDVEDGSEIRSNFPLRGQWDDVEGFKSTKTDSGRIAFFMKEAREAVRRVRTTIAKGEQPTDRVWPYYESQTWIRWVELQKRLKIENQDTHRPYRFHDLRHTAALRTLKRTGKLSDASTLCGHKNPGTTMIYTQQRPEDFVASLEKKGD